jgi:hypothetical protein
MFRITIQFSNTDTFLVTEERFKEVIGKTLVEALAKFNLALVQLQQDLHDEEVAELKERYIDDDIPF